MILPGKPTWPSACAKWRELPASPEILPVMNLLRSSRPMLLVLALSSWTGSPAFAALSAAGLRCEGLRDAPQVDTPEPRFSWHLDSDGRDVRQSAWQLRITEIDGAGRPLGSPVESARIQSVETQWISLPGFTALPRATYSWQVRVWDNQGIESDWSEARTFGTGLLGAKWPADWIGDGRTLELFKTAPARYFRHGFTLERKPVRARLYLSALGLVEPWLNGQPVTEDRFVPGWPDYRRRVFYNGSRGLPTSAFAISSFPVSNNRSRTPSKGWSFTPTCRAPAPLNAPIPG